jgi:membrane-associated phospholipid phosphatase
MTSHAEAAVGGRPHALIRRLAPLLGGAGLALLTFWVPQGAAARELPTPAVAIAAGQTQTVTEAAGLATAAPSAAAGDGAVAPAADLANAPGADGIADPGSDGVAASPAEVTASPPGDAASPPAASGPSPPPVKEEGKTGGVSAGMPVWRLFVVDAGSIFSAPARWTGHDWAVFGIGAASVVGLTLADKHLRTEALRGDAPLETKLANDFRYFGNYASFGVLGAFYIGGRIGHDNKAQETALDGLIASILGGGIITGVLKEVTGRYRPSTHKGVYTFKPFSGNASFPSGEATEAFAAGSVIAAEYPHLWVEIPCYGIASLVAFARMREDGHWASDVVAGALIGTTVGRAVVHLNRRLRARMNVSVTPLISPGAQGLTIRTAF